MLRSDIIWLLSLIIFKTLRVRFEISSGAKKYFEQDSYLPCVYAFWHGRLLYSFFAIRKKRPCAMLSGSRDGDMLAGVLKRWGYSLVRGSSGTGAGEVYAEALKALRGGKALAITPDGSRGPYREAHSGAFRLANDSSVPLVAIGVGFSSCWTLKSWDRFQIPKPFSKVTVVIGEPIENPGTMTKQSLSELLTEITDRADRLSVN
ncbi:MAG: lysophospholipid acyltransferase family protein [Fibrobacteres bacterium]|nr:lysophospholipid acyltransferase family protein [Fibrobacterota bacterium]